MAITLKKYQGELTLQCETPTCLNRGEYLFGEEKESIARKIILCKRCVTAIEKGVKQQSRQPSKQSQNS
ncbi:MAG: hypothetical protein J6A61_03360 [Clostridia bacterium]|nr:hypothetical protein [Clostridia bacterium]